MNHPFFEINTFRPSRSEVKVSRWTFPTHFRPFNKFEKDCFNDFIPGRYLKVDILEPHGDYDSIGEFFCKITERKRPCISYKESWFSGQLKNLQYDSGQITVEMPNGEKIPIYADSSNTEKLQYSDVTYYRISQTYSKSFTDICTDHLYDQHHKSSFLISFRVFKGEEKESLAFELKQANERANARRQAQVQAQERAPKHSWSQSEIEELWKKTE